MEALKPSLFMQGHILNHSNKAKERTMGLSVPKGCCHILYIMFSVESCQARSATPTYLNNN